jgi:alpha-beta hydrolase superfamily lysophospholipase
MNMMEIVLSGGSSEAPGSSSAKFILSGIRGAMWALRTASPGFAAQVAERLYFTLPPRPRVPEPAREVLRRGQPVQLKVRDRNVACWKWGAGPAVLLLHGWGGYAGQLAKFVGPLVDAGFSPIAFDAPGHGESDESWIGNRRVTLLDFSESVVAAVAAAGSMHALIAHSGGCAAAAIALNSGMRVAGLVFCAPMTRPTLAANLYSNALGLDHELRQRWQSNAEARFGFRWHEVDMTHAARFAGAPPALVIHDRGDREIPWSEAALLAETWPRAELHATEGLGHRKLLRDPSVIALATRYVQKLAAVAS